MTARRALGWQTLLADLALILFMVTAGALGEGDARPVPAPAPPPATAAAAPPEGPSLAIYRDTPGAPSLGAWLAEQQADARQQLTLVAEYAPGGDAAVLVRAGTLIRAARAAGVPTRTIIQPGPDGISATLAFDQAPPRP